MKTIFQLLGEVNLSSLSHLISAGQPSPALQILSPSVHYQKQDLFIPPQCLYSSAPLQAHCILCFYYTQSSQNIYDAPDSLSLPNSCPSKYGKKPRLPSCSHH